MVLIFGFNQNGLNNNAFYNRDELIYFWLMINV
jgi:hypothetical protein